MNQQATNFNDRSAELALERSRTALMNGDRALSYYWASIAVHHNPLLEEPHLILAALTPPRESIRHLQKALSINPSSRRAQAGLHWAEERIQTEQSKAESSAEAKKTVRSKKKQPAKRNWAVPVVSLLLGSAILLMGALLAVYLLNGRSAQTKTVDQRNYAARPVNALIKNDVTPETKSNPILLLTESPTALPVPTGTPTPEPTPLPTSTPEPSPTPMPSETPVQIQITPVAVEDSEPIQEPILPAMNDGRWIDVNLSTQQVFAYEGSSLVNSFIASTGTWEHPTVTGEYQIYIKYRYADMRGPDYYLTDVPYVMYFYKGYGLHGTYWHNNFGTPMSHGCINLITVDAGWLFNWASVGTVVNIHY